MRWIPYEVLTLGQYDYHVDVVGHHHECIQFHTWVMIRQILPRLLNDLARRIHPHASLDDFTEQACVALRADGHQIRPCLHIIKTVQSD